MNFLTFSKLRAVQDDSDLNDSERGHLLIATVKDISVETLLNISVKDFEIMASEARAEIEALQTPAEIKPTYVVSGVECRPHVRPEQMNAIQFSDLLTTLQQGEIDQRLHTLISIVLVPEGKTYPDYNRLALEEAIAKEMDVRALLAIAGEFKGLSETSRGDMLTSLVMTQATAWTGVPRWRRSLARVTLRLLLRVSPVNGRGKSGQIRSRKKAAAGTGKRRKGSGS